MKEIWGNKLLPKALKSCPKSTKSPNLVTLLQCYTSVRIVVFSTLFFNYYRLLLCGKQSDQIMN